jgi:hypothetical protein
VHADPKFYWGGVPFLSKWSMLGGGGGGGGDAAPFNATDARWARSFYVDARAKAIYKGVVRFLVTRVNSVDGTKYAEDPAIFGWELGVEMYDTAGAVHDASSSPTA